MHVQPLSPLNEHLATELRRDAALAGSRCDTRHESMPAFLHEFPYAVSVWPVFVRREIVREHVNPLIGSMPRILYQALRVRFEDSEAMVDYFGWPELIYHILEQAPVDPRDLLIRYDAVLDTGGLQLLETNCGSAAGGWQIDYFQPQTRAHMARLVQSHAADLGYRPILPALFSALADGICRRKPHTGGHVLVHRTFAPGGHHPTNFRDALQAMYDMVKPPALTDGRIVMFEEGGEIGFTAAGEVTAGGEIVDAILLGDALYADLPQSVRNRLITAHLREQIVFPDSPAHLLLSDKGVLAVLHEARSAGLLDAEDCALVDRFVPWTARLRDQDVLLEDVRVPLIRHLLAHKDDFVIKKFDSSAGRDVVIGRHVDAAAWQRAVRAHARPDERWIAQRFCAPSLLDLHDPTLGVVPHALIWGFFGYGGAYAGAFVRADHGVATHGVINAATGATELPVFEVG